MSPLPSSNEKTSAELGAQLNYDLSILRHMLGMGSHIPKRHWCHRNYFNSCPGHGDLPSLERLEGLGYVRRSERADYWHVTEAGCKAVGCTPAQTKKALHG